MNELQKYVDTLFQHQRQTTEVKDLKEEILSNMIAKHDDFLIQGMDKAIAIQKAKESLVSIEGLIEGNQLTYIEHYHVECLQTALLGSVICWIFTLPLLFTIYWLFSFCGLLTTIVLGILYITKSKHKSNTIAFVSVTASIQHKKWAWIIWGIFFLVWIGVMTALTFGSNLWFGRSLHISGPYQFANVVTRFYVPLLTIVFPGTIGSFPKILIKNEKRYENE